MTLRGHHDKHGTAQEGAGLGTGTPELTGLQRALVTKLWGSGAEWGSVTTARGQHEDPARCRCCLQYSVKKCLNSVPTCVMQLSNRTQTCTPRRPLEPLLHGKLTW